MPEPKSVIKIDLV